VDASGASSADLGAFLGSPTLRNVNTSGASSVEAE
jgi:hypothetical protein